jgi:RNA polymerase sigma-70 factor (ECF subfamily)
MTNAYASRSVDLVDAFDEVLGAARNDQPWAYRIIYESLAGRVCGYLESRGVPEPEDLTSEVFLRVFDNIAGFEGEEAAFRSWVYTIAHHLMVDDHRRRQRRPQLVQLPTVMTESLSGGDAELESLARIDEEWVAALLAALPPDQRDVLTLRIVGDLTVDQVAGVLGKSRGAVKALQRRAATNLRRRLEAVIP